jgi:hypothetical protein
MPFWRPIGPPISGTRSANCWTLNVDGNDRNADGPIFDSEGPGEIVLFNLRLNL